MPKLRSGVFQSMEMHASGEAWPSLLGCPSPIEGHDVSLPRRSSFCRSRASRGRGFETATGESRNGVSPYSASRGRGFEPPTGESRNVTPPREAAGSSPRWVRAEMGFRLSPPSRGRGFETPLGESGLRKTEGGGCGQDPCAVKGKGEARRPVKGKGEARRPVKGKGEARRPVKGKGKGKR